MTSPLPRPFLRLVWSNLAAQSAEQLSLAAVPIVAVLALLLRLNEPARQPQAD